MDGLNEDDYMKTRVDDQIKWYSEKSSDAQWWYKVYKRVVLLLSMSIPIAALVLKVEGCLKLYVAIAGAIIAIMEGLQSLNKYHENWISYRATSETLKQEKYMYLTKAGVYSCLSDENRFQDFAARCETIISSENINWAQSQQHECASASHRNGVNS